MVIVEIQTRALLDHEANNGWSAKSVRYFIVALIALGGVGRVDGESLELKVSRYQYMLKEPLVLRVVFTSTDPKNVLLDEPLPHNVRARRLLGELRKDAERVCDVFLVYSGALSSTEANIVDALGVAGSFTAAEGGAGTFVFWESPGEFELVVFDSARREESEPVHISLVAPDAELGRAANLFGEGGLSTMWALVGHTYGKAAEPFFQQLKEEYPNTTFAHYASMGLVLRRADLWLSRRMSGESITDSAGELVDDLNRCSDFFEPAHPLRGQALFAAAKVRAAAGEFGEAEKTIDRLLEFAQDTSLREKVKQYRVEMQASKSVQTKP